MVISKKDLGNLVKEARKIKSSKIGKKYTQVMLANDIGKSQGYIGDIESGRTYPTFEVLNDIAEACDIPFLFFTDDRDLIKEIIKRQDPSSSDSEVEELYDLIIHYNKSLPPEMKNITWGLDIYKEINDTHRKTPDYYNEKSDDDYELTKHDDTYKNMLNEIACSSLENQLDDVKDVKKAMDLILSQTGLMLNGEMLSDESKITLANAIQMGLDFAEKLEKEKRSKK